MATTATSTGASRRDERATDATATKVPGAEDAQEVFRNFTDATCALFNHPATPKALSDAIGDAIRDVGNTLGAYDEYLDVEARRVLSHVLELPEEQAEQAPPSPVSAPETGSPLFALADDLAANLQDDDSLKKLIKLAFSIAGEEDRLARDAMAITVAERAYSRTIEFSMRLSDILDKEAALHA